MAHGKNYIDDTFSLIIIIRINHRIKEAEMMNSTDPHHFTFVTGNKKIASSKNCVQKTKEM